MVRFFTPNRGILPKLQPTTQGRACAGYLSHPPGFLGGAIISDIVGEPLTRYLQPIFEGRDKKCDVYGELRNPNHCKDGLPAPEGCIGGVQGRG